MRKKKRTPGSSSQNVAGNNSRENSKQLGGRGDAGSSGPTTKKKPHHLKLVENDYFSQEDKHISNLRNLTQKAAHQYQGGLGPWQWASGSAAGNTNNASKGGLVVPG